MCGNQVFENKHFFAVDKRPGFLSVPSRLGSEDPRPCEIKAWSEKKSFRLWAIHRLDEEVSGVLLFAKTEEAHRKANQWFENRKIHKTYEAITADTLETFSFEEKLVWKSRLLRGKKRAYEREFGKQAITEASLMKRIELEGEKVCLWELKPLTGRSHQLRFEMAKHGYPILGDELYGSSHKSPIKNAILLRAIELELSDCEEALELGLPQSLKVKALEAWIKESKNQ